MCRKWISDEQCRLCGKGVRVMEEVKKMGLNHALNISFRVIVTPEDIDDIMVSALEGSMSYWANRTNVPKEKRVAEWGYEQIARGGELHIHVVEPFDQNGTEWYVLTKEKFLKGLEIYLKEPKYSDCLEFVNHELRIDTCYVDADVADTIVQYALFGEIVYG